MLVADAETIRYREAVGDSPAAVDLLDQTRLPAQVSRLVCTEVAQLHDAIARLVVRGAPAIGIAAAYGVTLARVAPEKRSHPESVRSTYRAAIDYLATSRPTAVNLFWALDRMRQMVDAASDQAIDDLPQQLAEEAIRIHQEDRQMCRAMGRHGAELLRDCETVLTHCNAGALATSTWGTALAPIYDLHENGHTLNVFADETRPLMQGARLTAWELSQAGIPVTVCTESMAGGLMRAGKVDAVIVGADRIAANGDVANKIGTYPLAVLARYHELPFYVVAPTNTFDRQLQSGDRIPIEQRDENEIRYTLAPDHSVTPDDGVNPDDSTGSDHQNFARGRMTVPCEASVINPAFDVTPAKLISGIITERGVICNPNSDNVSTHLS